MKTIVRFLDLDIPTCRVTAMFNGEVREYSSSTWYSIKKFAEQWDSGLERINQFTYKFNTKNGRGYTPTIVWKLLQGELTF